MVEWHGMCVCKARERLGSTALTILYGQMVQLVFCISNQVMWSVVGLEFQDKLLEVVHPGRVECQIFQLEEVQFKPFQGHAFEV